MSEAVAAGVRADDRSWVEEREWLEAIARAIEPSVRLVPKEGRFWTALRVLAAVATLGRIPLRTFLAPPPQSLVAKTPPARLLGGVLALSKACRR